MALFYLDSSALVKRYKPELGSEVVSFLFEQKGRDDRLVTSFLAVIEFSAMIARLQKGKLLTRSEANEVLAEFKQDVSGTITLIPVKESVLEMSVEVAGKHALRALDSIHMATILELQEASVAAGTELLVLAVDKVICEACEAERLTVINPEIGTDADRLRRLLQK